MRLLTTLGLASLLAVVPNVVLAAQADQVQVTEPKLRVMPGTSPGAGYIVLENTGEETAVMVAVGTEAYNRVEIHESLEVDGVYRMEQREAIQLEPGQSQVFQPGSYHLMFMQRQDDLAVGDDVSVWLEFADGSRQTVEFEVVPPTYR